MTKSNTLKRQLTEAQADLRALRGDRPKIVALLDKHTAALASAKRESDVQDFDQRAELQSKVDAFASVLTQHDKDIELLEADVETLKNKLDLQTTGERFAVVKEQHEKLLGEYRDAVRASLSTVQNVLSAELKARADVENVRQEIEQLGLKLGVFTRSTAQFSRFPIQGTDFKPLGPRMASVFDPEYPELKSDPQVINLLAQIADVDEVVRTGDTRQVCQHREKKRLTTATEQAEHKRAAYLAAQERQELERMGGVSHD